MKILFLLPPSEGKNAGGIAGDEKLSFFFEKPHHIAENATEKDLKCKDKRYEEGINLNKKLRNNPSQPSLNTNGRSYKEVLPAIERYSGVMYNAIDYGGMNDTGKQFFDDNFLIFSGMYGKVSPQDKIGNYKLPIETKGLYKYWGDQITESLNNTGVDYVVDLLPGAYLKMIQEKNLTPKLIRVNFLIEKNGKIVKMAHGVKGVKGRWVKDICERGITDYHDFGGEVVEENGIIHVNIMK